MPHTQGSSDNHRVSATVSFTTSSSGSSSKGSGNSGPLTSTDANWTPPGCWYAPEWTASQFQKSRQGIYMAVVHDPDARAGGEVGEIGDENEKYAKDDYHLGDETKGMWWGAFQNPDASYKDQWACDKPPFWVKNGVIPKVPNVVTPEKLAGYAYDHVNVPGTKVNLNTPVSAR
jgi:hypothetical protein